MKRIVLPLLLSMAPLLVINAGKRITISGVQYEMAADNTATATLTIKAKGDVNILQSVRIGSVRLLVTQLNEASFRKNITITGLILPKSLKLIKSAALRGCTKLTKIIFPTGTYFIERDAIDCNITLAVMDGNLTPFLEYTNMMLESSSTKTNIHSTKSKFSNYAEDKLKQRMQLWQTKKDYETMEQYRMRVTDENRRKRMDEYIEELKKEYTILFAPKNIDSSLGIYDDEYEIFTIRTFAFGNLYAHVPRSEAKFFEQNFNKVFLIPQYGIANDSLSIVSCQFKLDNKVYDSATNYAGAGESNYNFELPPLDINLAATGGDNAAAASTTAVVVDNAVDKNIPKGKLKNDKTFALIIGNEQYKRVAQVPFANNDAKIFAEYCKKTLGVPANNVKLYLNAGLNDMRHAVAALVNTLKAYDGEAKAIIYYAGHGVPDESNRMPYLLPVDGFATDIKSGYNLSGLYDELAEAPSQMTMVLLDACFSGTKREGNMLADTRGVAIETRSTVPTGNLLVFSASQGSETAYSDRAHGHGMFTYYLLKHLQETEGNTTMSKLTDYVITNVKRSSVTVNDGKMQTPTIIPSPSLMNTWQDLNF